MSYLERLRECNGERIAFDLDLTLTTDEVKNWDELGEEEFATELYKLTPNKRMIELLNELSENNTIYIFTARSDHRQQVTHRWLRRHGVNFNYYIMNKPSYTWFIDDRNINAIELNGELENE